MHVEGERCRGGALGELLRDQAVGLVVRAEPSEPGRDAESEKPRLAEVGVVVEGERRLAIVPLRPRGEALLREALGEVDQLTLARGRSPSRVIV